MFDSTSLQNPPSPNQHPDRITMLINRELEAWVAGQQLDPNDPRTTAAVEAARASIAEQIRSQELEMSPASEPFPPILPVAQWREEQLRVEQARLARAAGDPDRWAHPLRRSEPSPEVTALSKRLWADRSALVRTTGAYLIQNKTEDGQPTPDSPEHPLTPVFTNLVITALEAAGKPTLGPGRLTES